MSGEIHDSIRLKELRLVDDSGQDRVLLSSSADGVFMNFIGDSQSIRLRLGLSKNGSAIVEMGRESQKPNICLSVEKDGRVLVEGCDNEGVERFKLELSGNGSHTEVSFSEKYRKPRMILMAEDKGPAGIFILDSHGKALFSTT